MSNDEPKAVPADLRVSDGLGALVARLRNASHGYDEWRVQDPKDGPVAQVHAFLDKKVDAIKAGTISRKELVDQLVEKGISQGTASTQCGVWARNNGVQFGRPTQAAEAKKEQAASKRAAKKKAA